MKANASFLLLFTSEGEPPESSTPSSTQKWNKANKSNPESKAPTPPSLDDYDSDSSLEPDTLVPKYLELQTQLYSLCPDVFDKPKKGKKSGNADTGSVDPQVAKVQRKISRIENDVLFDRQEAEYHWKGKLDDLRKEASFFRRTQREEEKPPAEEQEQPKEAKMDLEQETDVLADDNENADLLGDMFQAEEPELETGIILDELNKATMHARDFGKWTGLSPRRVLEETCKSKYARDIF